MQLGTESYVTMRYYIIRSYVTVSKFLRIFVNPPQIRRSERLPGSQVEESAQKAMRIFSLFPIEISYGTIRSARAHSSVVRAAGS
jgi:hypothetical protein